jgi:GET complex subunit GET2
MTRYVCLTNSFTPVTEHQDASPSPSPQPQPQPQPRLQSQPTPNPPGQQSQTTPLPTPPPPSDNSSETMRAQQEYLRALLRASPPEQQSQQEIDQDPMMKMLSSMLGGVPGAENTAPGAGMPPPAQGDLGMNNLMSALGVPPLLSKMVFGGASAPQTPAEKTRDWVLKLLHSVFALLLGAYLVILVNGAVATYGDNPPAPATAQSPFVIFLTAELLLSAARMFWGQAQQGALSVGLQFFKSIMRDGSIAVFALGVGSWWNNGWQIAAGQ